MAGGGGGTRSKASAVRGRGTTHEARAYSGTRSDEVRPGVLIEPDATGIADLEDPDGYHQPTAMFDKGELLGELADLESGENVGATRHKVEADEGPRGCRLIVVAGPDLGVEWAFKQPEINIGRAAENDLDFPDIAVSRNHARISREGNVFYLTDVGSDNGTFLNGVKIEHEPLSSGDEVIIGARTLRFVELTDAPSTAAAHPVIDRGPDPKIGSQIVPSLPAEPEIGKSKVDVQAVPDKDGPSVSSSKAKATPKAAPSGSAVKLIVAVVVMLAVVVGAGFVGRELYLRLTHNTAAERELRSRRAFLQGVELVKARRFGDASALFDQALLERPEYVRAKEYREHADKETEVWRALEEARRLVAEKRWDEALDRLEKLPEETAWRPEIEKVARLAHRALAELKVEEAQTLWEAGERSLALDLIAEALAESPGLKSALALRETIDAAGRPVEGADRPKIQKPKTPPEMERAVTLYLEDRVAAAIDAAEAAGGPNSVRYIERMRQVQGLVGELSAAHKQKAAADLVRLAPEALKIDLGIGLGEGEVREKISELYADGLYLKALEANQDHDYPRAFQLWNQALKVRPGHKLSQTRLTDLSQKAKELYYQGYALKDSNAQETRKIFRQVTQMTRPSSEVHQWASKWLAANGG